MSDPTFRIRMAAEISGVKEGLIRAWERRYGVLKPARSPGGYRTYTQADIEVLKRLKRLTEDGVAIAEAVKMLPSIRREARGVDEPAEPRGKVSREEQLKTWREEVLAAGDRLDQQQIDTVLDAAIEWLPPLAFFDGFVVPLLAEVAARRMEAVEEQLICQPVRQRVIALLAKAPRRAKQHVVCVGLDEDEVGLLGAALHFRHQGLRVTFLGAHVPFGQLARLVGSTKPDLIAVFTLRSLGLEERLTALASALPAGTRVRVAGPGADPHRKLLQRLGFELDGEPH